MLLGLVEERFVPDGPVVVGLDSLPRASGDTIERRWGAKIKARGIYRAPVRSSHGHFVKTLGLRWLSLSLLADVPWAGRVWALPFLTVLCPSERYYARQAVLQVARRLPDRRVVVAPFARFSDEAALRPAEAPSVEAVA